jgi:histone acetyltransferase (RNA polymerase elongator complex component)
LLKRHGVTTVELGAQSMDDGVLKMSGRGHTVADILEASEKIRSAGIRLGLQMMLGLPGDTFTKSRKTARSIVKAGAVETRIYPTLVIKGTGLEKLYREGKYEPLSLKEAVKWSTELVGIFEEGGVNIIRAGLHPSEGIITGEELVAGPFHISFRELVMTEIWWEQLKNITKPGASDSIKIYVAPGQFNFAVGYEAKNRKRLMKKFKNVVFHPDKALTGRNYETVIH